jgi:alkylation response protein AidB-like acyl-CoA dehydrogenase
MTAMTDEELRQLQSVAEDLFSRYALSAQQTGDRTHAPTWSMDAVSASLWKQMAELGWTALLVPEESGGVDAGIEAAAAIAMASGYHLSSNDFVSSAMLGTSLLRYGGTEAQKRRWLPGVAAGDIRVAGAIADAGGRPVRHSNQCTVTATRRGDGWVLDGQCAFVWGGADADLVVVAAAADDDPPRLFAVGGEAFTLRRRELIVDRTASIATLVLDGVTIPTEDELPDWAAATGAALRLCGLARAADAVGAARRALELSVGYAKTRVQFNRPIGSFQAIKHKLADMYLLTECAQIAVRHAAREVDAAGERSERYAAGATAYALTAASRVTGDAIQVHGGIGYTWEHDCHRLFKRAKFDEFVLGDPAFYYDILADHMIKMVRR